VDQTRSWPLAVNGIQVPYGASTEQLAPLLHESKAAPAAIVALEKLGTPESLDVLMPLLERDGVDWHCRQMAAGAIGRHPLGCSQSTQVLKLLDDPAPEVFCAAAWTSAQLGLADAIPRLMARLQDDDRTVRAGAFNAITVMRPASELGAFLALYRAGDYEQQKHIGPLIERTFYPAVWLDVFEVLHASEVGRHREWAARIAQEFAGVDQLPKLELMTTDCDGHVRGTAVRAIAAIKNRCGQASFSGRDRSALVSLYDLGRCR
jgi:hypothetical protein